MTERRATEVVERNRARLRGAGMFAGAVLLAIVVVPFVLLAAAIYVLWAVLLRFLVLVLWSPRGYRVLVVYSNSPHWKQYFEEHIVPRLGSRCVVLNWSERRRWSFSLAKCLFWLYGGHRAYNPLVVVVRPFGRAKIFRFWQAFRDAKHDHPEPLRRLEAELFTTVEAH